MKRTIRFLAILIVLSAAAVGAYAWLKGSGSEEQGFVLVDVTTGAITEKAVAVGKIEPRQKFQVKSKISGIVRAAQVDVGDRVTAGAPLFEIVPDPTPTELLEAERAVESASSAHRKAEADFARAEELSRSGILPRGDMDATRERFEQARITLDETRDRLELIRKGRLAERAAGGPALESTIRAPAGGTVLERLVNPGDPVVPLTSYQAGTPLATIADMGELLFRGTVDEIDVGKLRLGLPARLRVGALPEDEVTGTLTRIAPQATERDNAKLFEVEIELDPKTEVVLRAGYSANADLVIREKKDIVLVPERLVTFEDGGKRASVEVPADGPGLPPKKVEIETGLSDGLNVEVLTGLAAGDKVVQRPPREIQG